jgi:hypothetical protein
MKRYKWFYTLLCSIFFSFPLQAQFFADIETGLAFQSYNDVRIPNQNGTLFSFTDDFQLQDPLIPIRGRLGYTFGIKNHLSVLIAPLWVNYEGLAPFDIQFQNSMFSQGVLTRGFYKFNSFRLTYRRDLIQSERWILGLGFTGKIRDASVQLENILGVEDRKDDLGFVPLLHLYVEYHWDRWGIYFEGDGLAGGPGRAFDLFIGPYYKLTNAIALKAGYRMLEGGANIDEVYNFTMINFAIVGVVIRPNRGG